ncbi:MAG: MATE family efflux transporter [Lachnospiraceae bacterium]|nr:MATE family efflux transporter [Lachnospiraceae bacterium]
MEKSHIKDFTQGNITKQLIMFATPLFLSSLLQIVYNMVDMMIVGQKLGKVGLSAVSVGGDVTNFLTFLAMGFSNAGQVIISQYLGAGQREKIPRFISTMFSFLMLLAVGASGICLVLREPIMHAMNTPKEAFSEAIAYATVSMLGMVFIYGYNIVSAVLRGMGDSIRPFIFISIAAVLNTILDIVFVMGMDMGSKGAALATVISQGSSFVGCGTYMMHHKEHYELKIKVTELFYIDKGMLSRLVKLGIPMAIKNASVHVSKLFVNSWINSYGVAVSAFAGIANKIGSTANLVSNSFNAAGSSMVGQNIGAKKYERVKGIMFAVFRITVSTAILFSVVMYGFPRQIFSFFTKDVEVIKVGMTYLPIAVLMFFGSAARSGMNALINGSGNYRVNFATAIFDGIIMRIGLAVLFGLTLHMKAIGFWLGDALAGFTPFWIGMVFYISGKWKTEVER